MASSDPVTWQLALVLQAQLQKVRTANGFYTDIGAEVLIEDTQTPTDASVLPTIIDVNLTTRTTDAAVNRRQRSVDFTVQASIKASLANAKYLAHCALADIEKILDQQADILPKGFRMAKAVKAEILKRPEGLDAMVIQVIGTANYLPGQ